MGYALLIIAVMFYLIPTMVASSNKKRNIGAITVLNIFLGWTFLGWIGALIWACTKEPDKQYKREHLGYAKKRR